MTDRYEYLDISDKSKQFAVDDLGENPSQVNAHIESFRRWLSSMPHLKCPTDAKFLIKFLRVSKFDHKRAQKRLDNYCTCRASPRGSPNFFETYSLTDPIVDMYLDLGMHLPLGRAENGEMIFLVRTKMWDIDKIPFSKLIILMFMTMDILASIEETQIHGIKMLIDLQDASRKSMEAWSDPKYIKQINRMMQDSYPFRVKGTIFYNEPVIFDIVYQVFSFFLNEKMRSRTMRIKNDINKAIEKIPGLENILPTEYNGKGGSIKECSAKWKMQFKEFYKNGSPITGISVDETKRPQETVSYLADYPEYKGETLGTQGTYTKFENVF